MLKINEDKTLKELREKGFYVYAWNLLFPINSLVSISFDLNRYDEYYLRYNGIEMNALLEPGSYDKEIEEVLEMLKIENFVIEVKDEI